MDQKTVFIIPGFRHKPTHKAYKEIAKIVRQEGYTPVLVSIPWRKHTISENTQYFINQYKRSLAIKGNKINRRKIYLLGFSFGAMIALIASTKLKVRGLILCSLSPYFKEDLQKIKKSALSLQPYRYNDFVKLHSGRLAKQVKAKHVSLLYGTKESKSLVIRVKKTYNQISSTHKYLLPVKKTEHNIGDKKYLHAIHQVTRNLD